VSDEAELVGMWSADHMYGPGAHSDERLFFKEDGTGRFEIINLILCSVDFFQWELSEPSRITLRGYRRLEPDDAVRHVIEAASGFEFINLPFQIQEEDTKSGKRMRVLRLKLYKGVSDHYGFVRRDLSGWWEEPHFFLED